MACPYFEERVQAPSPVIIVSLPAVSFVKSYMLWVVENRGGPPSDQFLRWLNICRGQTQASLLMATPSIYHLRDRPMGVGTMGRATRAGGSRKLWVENVPEVGGMLL